MRIGRNQIKMIEKLNEDFLLDEREKEKAFDSYFSDALMLLLREFRL
jgi:hypothetical protein